MSNPQNPNQGSQNSQQPSKKSQFQARLDNQKAQLERHGNFAEVVIRTTPEGTDMINFARLWEYVLVQADRQTRGYVAKSSREDFEKTRQDFQDSLDFMASKIKQSVARHKMDLAGTNFISRVAQRYHIVEKKRGGQPQEEAQKPKPAAKSAVPVTPVAEQAVPVAKAKPKRVAAAPLDAVDE
ncbi:MAG: hypothetical protein WAX89_03630 [Alphaproteobacteria bacterium]